MDKNLASLCAIEHFESCSRENNQLWGVNSLATRLCVVLRRTTVMVVVVDYFPITTHPRVFYSFRVKRFNTASSKYMIERLIYFSFQDYTPRYCCIMFCRSRYQKSRPSFLLNPSTGTCLQLRIITASRTTGCRLTASRTWRWTSP